MDLCLFHIINYQCSTCQKFYIGETAQKISQRRKQHESDVRRMIKTNGIYEHLRQNPGHTINWDDQKVLLRENNWKLRKLKESILIEAWNPTKKMRSLMNLEKGLEIDSCWRAVAAEIRGSTKIIGRKVFFFAVQIQKSAIAKMEIWTKNLINLRIKNLNPEEDSIEG